MASSFFGIFQTKINWAYILQTTMETCVKIFLRSFLKLLGVDLKDKYVSHTFSGPGFICMIQQVLIA